MSAIDQIKRNKDEVGASYGSYVPYTTTHDAILELAVQLWHKSLA